jgi:hypothetical protein
VHELELVEVGVLDGRRLFEQTLHVLRQPHGDRVPASAGARNAARRKITRRG